MEEKKKPTFGFINFKWGLNAALLILLSFLVCSLSRTPKWLFHIFFLFKSIFFLSCLSFSGCLINTLAFLLWSPLLVPLSIPVIVLLSMNHLKTYWLQTNYYILKLFFSVSVGQEFGSGLSPHEVAVRCRWVCSHLPWIGSLACMASLWCCLGVFTTWRLA